MLRVVISIVFIHFLTYCSKSKRNEEMESENQKISILLEKSATNELPIDERLKFVDSAFNLSKKTAFDSLNLEVIAEKSNLLYKAKKKDSSFFYDKYLLKKANQLSNSHYSAEASLNIALYLKNQGVYDSAFYHFNQARNHFLKLDDSSKVGRQLMSMGLIQKNQNDFFGSKETITEGLKYLQEEKDKKYIASSYNTLGTNHRKLLNFGEAVNYFKKAINKTQSAANKLAYKNNLAATLIDNQEFDKAVQILREIEADSTLKKSSSQYARVLDNLTYAQWLSGKKMKPKAFLIPLKIRKQNNDKRGQIASYTHLGEFYGKTDPKRAESYFDSVIQLAKTLKIPRAEKDVLKFLVQLQPKNINLRDRYVFLQDSLYARELKVKTQFAKYKYDDKLKQESILRLEAEKAEKALEANQQRNQKIIYLGGAIFLASILGLSFYSFKQRTKRLKQENKTARLEASYETEGALSRKLHDDYGGKLNHTISLVQNGADKLVILDNLESLDKQSRDFSREINEVDTGQNYKDELLGMLGSRKPLNIKLFTTGLDELDWSVLPALTKTTLFKVLQELMINMSRHSKANTVVITLKNNSKGLMINYEDDGIGASKKELQIKNGLRNTEKRIQAIYGTITFDSEKGNGFRAEIRIPN